MSLLGRIIAHVRRPFSRKAKDPLEWAPELYVLRLEERRVLNGAPLAEFAQLDAGSGYADDSGLAAEAPSPRVFDAGLQANDGQADLFVFRSDAAGGVEVVVNGAVAFRGAIGDAGLVFQGSSDGDTLLVDFSHGNPLTGGGLTFDTGLGGADSLIFTGGAVDSVLHAFGSAESAGLVDYQGQIDGGFVHATGLELGSDRVVDSLTASFRTLEFRGLGENVRLADTELPDATAGIAALIDDAAFLATAAPSESLEVRLDRNGQQGEWATVSPTNLDLRIEGASLEGVQLSIHGQQSSVAFTGDGALQVASLTVEARRLHIAQSIAAETSTELHASESLFVSATGGVTVSGTSETAGAIGLDAGAGRLDVAGQISASTTVPGLRGGEIHLLGGEVVLAGTARIDASGAGGGGTILVGGDYQGNNPAVRNARRTVIEPGARLRADALQYGDGGRVIIWADERTHFAGELSARGGAAGGDGGFAEISGKETLTYRGQLDLSAPQGAAGSLLLDPKNITIALAGVPVTGANDGYNNLPDQNVTITAASIMALTSAGTNVTLQANTDIFVDVSVITVLADPMDDAGSLTLQAGRSIFIAAGVTIDTSDADLTLIANDSSNAVRHDHRDPGNGRIEMGDGSTLDAGAGDLTLRVDAGGANPNAENDSGDITLENLIAANIVIANLGPTGGSGVRRTSDDATITATTSLAIDVDSAGAEVGTSSQPLEISAPVVAVAGQSGGVFLSNLNGDVTVGEAGNLDGISTAGGGDVEITAIGNISLVEGITAAGAGDIALDAGSGEIFSTADGSIVSGSGDITLTANHMALLGTIRSTGGALLIQPGVSDRGIAINVPAADEVEEASRLDLETAELALLDDGFSSITIGRADGQHAISVGAVSFADPLTIRTPDGGSIDVLGQLDTLAGNAANSLTLIGPGATTTLLADVVTAGGVIQFSDAVRIGDGLAILVDSTDGGAEMAGADVIFEGRVNGHSATAALETLTINAGTGGAVQFQDAVGDMEPLNLTIVQSLSVTFDDEVHAATMIITDTESSVVFLGNTTIDVGLNTAAQGYSIELTGSLNSVAGDTTFLNTGGLTLGNAATDQITFADGMDATAVTGPVLLAGMIAAGDAAIDLGSVSLTANTVIDTGTGAAATLNVGAVSSGGRRLTLDAGDAAAITVASFSGGGDLEVRDSASTTFSGAVTAGTVTLTDTTGAIAFRGNATINTALQTTGQGYSVEFTGGSNSIAGATIFQNTGALTLGDDESDQITFGGGVTATAVSGSALTGTIAANDAAITFGDVFTGGDVFLESGAGAAAEITLGNVVANGLLVIDAGSAAPITMVSFTEGDLEIRNSSSTTVSGSVDAGTVTLTDTTGAMAFQGNTRIFNSLQTANQGYSVSFTGSDNSVGGDTTFLNTGGLTLGNAATDRILFEDGVTGPASGPVSLAGTIAATDSHLDFGNVTLTKSVTLDSGAGALAAITVGNVTGGGNSLTLDAGPAAAVAVGGFAGGGNLTLVESLSATFSGAVTAGAVDLQSTTNSVSFAGDIDFQSLATNAGGYSLTFLGSDNSIANFVMFDNTGLLILSDAASDHFTFANGATVNGPLAAVLAGLIETQNDTAFSLLAPASLAADTTIRSDGFVLGDLLNGGGFQLTLEPDEATDAIQIGAGALLAPDVLAVDAVTISRLLANTFAGIVIGRADGQHQIVVGAADFADPLTIRTLTGGAIAVNGPLTTTAGADAASLVLDAGGGLLTLGADVITRGGAMELIGSIQLADGAAVLLDVTDGGLAPAGAALDITGTINGHVPSGNGGETLAFNAGETGVLQFNVDIGAAQPLDLTIVNSASTTFTGAVNAGVVTLQDTAGAIVFEGNTSLDQLITAGNPYSVSFIGDVNLVGGSTTFLNTGAVTLGNGGTDLFVFSGGVATTGGANGPSLTQLAGSLLTLGGTMTFGPTELQGAALLDATAGGGFPAGAPITFTDSLDGTFDLTINAGDAAVNFDHGAGQTTPLANLAIASAGQVVFWDSLHAAGVRQDRAAVGAITAFLGMVETSGPAGIDLTAFDILFAAPVQTAGGGGVRLANSGLLEFAAAADHNLDGAFTQLGPGAVRTAADIVTTGDDVSFSSGVSLTGHVTIDTGAGPGNISFGGDVAGGGFDLTLDAGQGDVAIALASNLGALTVRDGDVQTYGSLGVASLDIQNAGSSVLLQGAVTSAGPVSVVSQGGIDQDGAVTAGTNLIYDAAGEIRINSPIDAAGAVAIDSGGLTTIAPGSGITAGASIVLGASRTGALQIAADLRADGADVTLHNAAALAGNVRIDSQGPAAGDIRFLSTVATGGATLTLAAGTGDLEFSDSVTGGGTLVVESGAVQTFHAVAVDSFQIQSVSTRVDLLGSVVVSGDVAIAGSGALVQSGSVAASIVTYNLAGIVDVRAAIDAAGDVTLDSGMQIILAAAGDVTAGGNVALGAAGAGPIATAGNIDAQGRIDFHRAVLLTGDVLFISGGGLGDDVVFHQTLDGAHDLTVATGPAGDIRFNHGAGAATPLQSLTITSAHNVAFGGALQTAGDVRQTAGAGTTFFRGTSGAGVGGDLDIATDAVIFAAADFHVAGNADVQTQNAISLDASLTSGGRIAILANQDGSGAEGFTQTAGMIHAAAAVADAIVLQVGGSGAASVMLLSADGASGGVTVIVGGAVLDNNGADVNVIAHEVTVTAGQGINLDLAVNEATLETAAGDIDVIEADGAVFHRIAAPGSVTVITAGDTVLEDGSGQTVNVLLNSGDLTVGTVNAADTATLSVTAGAILDDGVDATRIIANLLTLQAAGSAGAPGSGALDTSVGELSAVAGGEGVFLQNSQAILLRHVEATAAGGDVSVVAASGDVLVGFVTADDAVFLESLAGLVRDAMTAPTPIEAGSIELHGAEGIGDAAQSLRFTAQEIAAESADGAVHLASLAAGPVTATSIIAGDGPLLLIQTGGFDLDVVYAEALLGDIQIRNHSGNLTVAATTGAGRQIDLATEGSGDVFLVEVRGGAGSAIQINSAGDVGEAAADPAADLIAESLLLRAAGAIGAADPLEVTASTIDAEGASVSLNSLAGGAVQVVNYTAVSGGLQFHQTGGQTVTFLVAAAPGSISFSNDGAGLMATAVSAASGEVRLVTTTAGDVAIDQISAGTQIVLTAADAIVEATPDAAVDLIASSAALRSRTGIGGADALQTQLGVLAAENLGPGGIRIDQLGAALTIGEADGLSGVRLADPLQGGGAIHITADRALTAARDIVNESGGDILLTTTGPAGHMTIAGRLLNSGGDGEIFLTSGGNLTLSDSGEPVDIAVVGDGRFLAEWEGSLSFGPGVLITSATGAVASAPPTLAEIEAQQVTALGEATITGNFGVAGERNFTLFVDWADGSSDTVVLADAGDFSLMHVYVGNPDRTNPAAPIPITLTLTNDPNISFAGLDSTTFRVGTADVTADGDSLLIHIFAPVPGEGLIAGVGKTATSAATNSAVQSPRTESLPSWGVLAPPVTASLGPTTSGSEAGVDLETYLAVIVLTPVDDDGTVSETVVRRLPLEVLNDLPALFRLLPNDRYRILLVRRDGSRLPVIEGLVRDGKFFDPSGAAEQSPTARGHSIEDLPPEEIPGALPPQFQPQDENGPVSEPASKQNAEPELPLSPPAGGEARTPAEHDGPSPTNGTAMGFIAAGAAAAGRTAGIRRRRENRLKEQEEQSRRTGMSKAARAVRRLWGGTTD